MQFVLNPGQGREKSLRLRHAIDERRDAAGVEPGGNRGIQSAGAEEVHERGIDPGCRGSVGTLHPLTVNGLDGTDRPGIGL